MAVILRYFAEFVLYCASALGKCWLRSCVLLVVYSRQTRVHIFWTRTHWTRLHHWSTVYSVVKTLICTRMYMCVVAVCPHAGGVGLCEMVQHLSIFDYICVSRTFDNRSALLLVTGYWLVSVSERLQTCSETVSKWHVPCVTVTEWQNILIIFIRTLWILLLSKRAVTKCRRWVTVLHCDTSARLCALVFWHQKRSVSVSNSFLTCLVI